MVLATAGATRVKDGRRAVKVERTVTVLGDSARERCLSQPLVPSP